MKRLPWHIGPVEGRSDGAFGDLSHETVRDALEIVCLGMDCLLHFGIEFELLASPLRRLHVGRFQRFRLGR
jgi:hypothetical protein